MSGASRYRDLLLRGEIVQFRPIPVGSFTVREIAELFRDGYVYRHYFQGEDTIRAALGVEDI